MWVNNKNKKYILGPTFSQKLNIWAAFWAKGIIGITIFKDNLNANIYLDILRRVLLRNTKKLKKIKWKF